MNRENIYFFSISIRESGEAADFFLNKNVFFMNSNLLQTYEDYFVGNGFKWKRHTTGNASLKFNKFLLFL